MDVEFTWRSEKARRNLAKHRVSFETAKQVFSDPCLVILEDREDERGEVRYQAIGYANSELLLLVVFVDRSKEGREIIQRERQTVMSRVRTPISSRKGINISESTRKLYEDRDRSLDNDPDAPMLPPEKWAHAMRRDEFFRPIKKQTTVRIDADVLAWLRSQGEGHLSRINEILRERMEADKRSR
ncbi:MAG TPA: BrnT family toxin [Bryobacteraceae bacterium]|nr:BrnT family toxin [Bryobacteraceae bacterium]